MGQYFEFLLNLAGEGDDRTIADSLAFAPIAAVLPKNAFECKVICDAAARVFVIACAEGGGHEVIGLGKFGESGIRHRKQLKGNTVPTTFQWDLFECALRKNALLATGHRPGHDTVVDLDRLLRTLEAKRRAFANPPPELPTSIGEDAPPPGRAPRWVWVAIGAGAIMLGIGIAVTRAKRSRTTPPPVPVAPTPMTPPAPEPAVAPPVEPPPEVPVPAPAQPATLADAIAQHRRELIDTADEMSPGARKLATFAAAKLTWVDVDGPAETSIGHVLKDSEAERGKRMCVEGAIRTIERRDLDGRKVFVGRLHTADDDEVAFVAVGSTGDLIRKSRGKLCGVVTGKSRGAVALVGMFDLPENRRPIVEQ